MAPKRREPVPAAAAPPGSKRARAAEPPPSPGARLRAAARTVLVVLFLIRGKDSGGDSLARVGRVLRAMWGKLVRMEERQQRMEERQERMEERQEGMEEQIQALHHKVDKIARSSPTPRKKQRLMKNVNRKGTSAEAEGLASNGGDRKRASIRLRFLNRMKSPIFQDDEIKSDSNAPIRIGIFDGDNMIKSGPLSEVKIEILALEGNFPFDASDSWTAKDFNKHRASGRDGNGNVLAGEGKTVRLINGEREIDNIKFREGSCSASKRMFITGARVCDGEVTDVRVQEAIMNPVVVKDRRSKSNEKSQTPKLKDKVHRLEEISKDGTYSKRLEKEKIYTVEDFLKALNKDPDNLAKILQINKEHKPWEKMIRHARKCCLKGKHKLKSYPCKERNVVLYFNCVHDLVGAEFGGRHTYIAHDKFDSIQQALVDELKGSAYNHLDTLHPDYIMTETDNFPRPLNMDTGAGSSAGPSYMSSGKEQNCSDHVAAHQVRSTPAAEYLSQAQVKSSCATANNDPGPSSSIPDHHSRDNYRDEATQLVGQGQFPSASHAYLYQDILEQPNSSVGIIEDFLFGYDAHPQIQGYSTNCSVAVERGLDQMEIQGQMFSQVYDTFEASTSACINMPLAPQQLGATGAPGSTQRGMRIQMQAPLPSNGASETPASPKQALPPQQWPQCQGEMPWNG